MMVRSVAIGVVGWALVTCCLVSPAAADTWPTYAEIGTTLAAREAAYPGICKVYDLGLTVQGRHMWALRISDNVLVDEDEPEMKYISTMHGDEIVGAMLCMKTVDYLLTNYGTDSQVTALVDGVDIWLVPLMNPDGYDRASRTRYNANGVDLNRDFPEGGGPGAPDPNTTTGRAIETANIMNWSFANSFTLAANFHGGALVVNYPFDNDNKGSTFSPTPDEDLFVNISERYSILNPPMWASGSFYHGITNGAEWYTIDGGMQDWSYRYMGCNEVTIELDDNKQPPASQIPTLWNNNRAAMLAYLETCLLGVRGVITHGVTGLPLSATVAVSGRNHNVFTDPNVGDYHRMLLPGTYALVYTAPGCETLTANGLTVTSGPATRLDLAMGPAVTTTWPNGGETLTAGLPVDVTWSGNLATPFQVQYSSNYGDTGLTTDGFESGSLSGEYTTGGSAPWYVITGVVHAGTYSARSGAIAHTQTTWMTRNGTAGPMSFWYKVSSEINCDWFNFYIDGVQKLHKSGTVQWTRYATTLGAGTHVLKWEYVKDASVNGGNDTTWIDDVEVTGDATVWTDIAALTPPGAASASWTPTTPGSDYKVRVRTNYGGSIYGAWDESDALFTVAAPSADGDYDDDGDVDLSDFSALQVCFGPAAPGDCTAAFDFDGSTEIDLADLDAFVPLLEASGPGQ